MSNNKSDQPLAIVKPKLDELFKLFNLEPPKEDLSISFLGQALQCTALFDAKQRDYGPNNISKFGEIGVYVRLSDKIERLCNLVRSGKNPANEPLDDSLMDIANYAIIALMIRKGLWPK